MRDDFLSLRAWLERSVDPKSEAAPAIDIETKTPEEAPEVVEDLAGDPALEQERAAALSRIRRFRAALDDALETVVADALREVVAAVLGRELTVAPVEIRAIVERVIATCVVEDVLSVHVHPDDRDVLDHDGRSIVTDPSLRRGDVTVTLRYGSIDATLGARLADVLAAFGAA